MSFASRVGQVIMKQPFTAIACADKPNDLFTKIIRIFHDFLTIIPVIGIITGGIKLYKAWKHWDTHPSNDFYCKMNLISGIYEILGLGLAARIGDLTVYFDELLVGAPLPKSLELQKIDENNK